MKTILDADQSVFFAREVNFVKAKTYDVTYPNLKARDLFPVSYEAGEGAETVIYTQYDAVGIAKIISSYADDLPRAEITGKEFTARVRSLGNSYGYNIDEIEAARLAGKPLQQKKADAARRANLELENKIAFFGDSAYGILGFFNNPNIPTYTLPNGASGTATWATKTPAEILSDMNRVVNLVSEQTNGIETAKRLVLPIQSLNYIAATSMNATNGDSILTTFLKNSPFIGQKENVIGLNECKGAGPGGVNLMFAYDNSPDKIQLEIPLEWKQYPEQPRNLEFVVPCRSKIAGVLCYYPLSAVIAQGL